MAIITRSLICLACIWLVSLGVAQIEGGIVDAPAPPPASIAEAVASSVVAVQGYDAQGKASPIFTGVVVAEDKMVVNWHMLRGLQRVEACTATGIKLPVREVLAEDRIADLVLLRIDPAAAKLTPLSFATTLPCEEEAVYCAFLPKQGTRATVVSCAVTNIRFFPLIERIWQLSSAALPVQNGSLMFTADGKALGMVTQQTVNGAPTAFVIPAVNITRLTLWKNPFSLANWNARIPLNWEETAEGQYSAGMIALWGDDLTGATEHLGKATVIQPDSANAWLHYADAVLLSTSSLTDKQQIARLQEKALAAAQTAVRLAPRSADTHEMLGTVLADMAKITQAMDEEQAAITLNPGLARAYSMLGSLYTIRLQYPKAIEEEQAALQLRADNVKALLFLNQIYLRQRQWAAMVTTSQQILRWRPSSLETYCDLGTAYAFLGKWEETGESYYHAVMRNPQRTESYISFAQLLPVTGNGSATACNTIIKLTIKAQNCLEILDRFGWALGSTPTPHWDDALFMFATCTQIDANDYRGFYGMGFLYSRLGKYPESAKAYEEGLRLNPKGINIRVALASSYLNLKRYTDAEQLLAVALEKEPKNIEAHYGMGCVQAALNNRPAVQQEYEYLQQHGDARAAALQKWLDQVP